MKLTKILAVAIPIVVMAAWTGKHVLHTKTGARVRFSVKGYDPRDLLAGHFLRYTVEYGPDADCGAEEGVSCLCLTPSSATAPSIATGIGDCEERGGCPLVIKGVCRHGRFEAGIERFYMPEAYSKKVPVIPPNAEIEVSLDNRGNGVVTGFFVEGKPLKEFVEAQGK